jgi:serine/threonine-protein kinase
LFSFALHGSAQTKASGNRAAAEALFNQGRNLMTAGKYTEACPKFEASQELDPGLGTMLNLAECYEKTGRTASAWAEYRQAIPLARASGSKARQDLAVERAQALEERLSTLTIRAMSAEATDAQLEVRRDGIALQPAELGAPIPVDPGEHVIEAKAPGHEPWSSKVQVGADAARVSVEIPKLKPTGVATPAAEAPLVTTTTATTNAPPSDQPASDGRAQRVTGLVLGGAGIVGVGLGTFFGLRASSKWSDAKDKCTDYPYGCGTEGTDLRSSARSAGNVSTIAFVAGGALLATGVVLYLTAPTKKESVALNVGPQSLFVEGSF